MSIPQDGSNFDLVDTSEELAQLDGQGRSRLAEQLRECAALVAIFQKANRSAAWHQAWHRWIGLGAALFGTAAVLFAVWQLALMTWPSPHVTESLEFSFAIVTIVVVLLGLIVAFDRRWRGDRLRAEACRFAKFNFLLNNGQLWGEPERSDASHITDRVGMDKACDAIARIDRHGPKRWVLRQFEEISFDRGSSVVFSDADAESLVEYYRKKRYGYLANYFRREAHRRHWWEHLTRRIVLVCFTLSVIAACAHFVYEAWMRDVIAESLGRKLPPAHTMEAIEMAHHAATATSDTAPLEVKNAPAEAGHPVEGPHAHDAISLWLLLAAALLPVLGAGLRTVRGAHEFGRNTNRYLALVRRLDKLDGRLKLAKTSSDKLNLLWEMEWAIEDEHRSWQRLMVESEWFG